MTLQLRVEALNVTNTPHFANPASNVSNLQLNPDGTVRNLNGFGVITSTTRLGRQYDEREWRLGREIGVLGPESRLCSIVPELAPCKLALSTAARHATIDGTEESA